MIYCYYDKNGILREIINNQDTRKGDSTSTIRVYIENELDDITSMSVIFKIGTITSNTILSKGTDFLPVPYSETRNYKYFKDFTPYKFYVFEVPTEILANNGLCKATFSATYGSVVKTLGLLTFNIEDNLINEDNLITLSQFDYLLTEIAKYENVFNTAVIGKTTNIVDGSDSSYTDNQLVITSFGNQLTLFNSLGGTYHKIWSSQNLQDEVNKNKLDIQSLQNALNSLTTRVSANETKIQTNAARIEEVNANIPKNVSELNNDSAYVSSSTTKLQNYYTKTQSDERYAKAVDLGAANLVFTIDTESYMMTAYLTDKNGSPIGEKQYVDLPIESVVVTGRYNAEDKAIELVLENESVVSVPVGDLIAGLQTQITDSNKLNADLVEDGVVNKTFKTADKQKLDSLKNYTLPVATPSNLGGVKPTAKTDEMTDPVGVNEEGQLFTKARATTGEVIEYNAETKTLEAKKSASNEGVIVNSNAPTVGIAEKISVAGQNYAIPKSNSFTPFIVKLSVQPSSMQSVILTNFIPQLKEGKKPKTMSALFIFSPSDGTYSNNSINYLESLEASTSRIYTNVPLGDNKTLGVRFYYSEYGGTNGSVILEEKGASSLTGQCLVYIYNMAFEDK